MALEAGGHPRPIAPATSQPMTSRLLSSWPSCNGEAVPFVLRRLAEAARRAGKMPPSASSRPPSTCSSLRHSFNSPRAGLRSRAFRRSDSLGAMGTRSRRLPQDERRPATVDVTDPNVIQLAVRARVP